MSLKEIDLTRLHDYIPMQWRVQSVSDRQPTATCIPYIDARQVMDLLDEHVGPQNWQSEFYNLNGAMFCKIGIFLNNQWIWKSDAGSEGNIEKEKSLASDCLKRAAVNWGIGRFLYTAPPMYINTNEKAIKNDKGKITNKPYPMDKDKNRIWDITKYIDDNPSTQLVKYISSINYLPETIITALDELKTIKDKDSLRIVREKYKLLEDLSGIYKRALFTQYKRFN